MLHRATEKVVMGLLPVLDSFDAALSTQPQTETEDKLYSGMINTREQLLNVLKGAGLELIPTFDEPFDPEIHEPVGAPTGTGTNLVVTDELRRGYRLNGKVLRAALVALEAEAMNRDWVEKDFYEVLGVAEASTPEEIKKAYRKLAQTASS